MCLTPVFSSCPSLFSFLSQYARDFYLGQWLQDTQVELEKALKGDSVEPAFASDAVATDDGDVPGISESATVLQQAEDKKEMLYSLMDIKTLQSLRSVLDHLSSCLNLLLILEGVFHCLATGRGCTVLPRIHARAFIFETLLLK